MRRLCVLRGHVLCGLVPISAHLRIQAHATCECSCMCPLPRPHALQMDAGMSVGSVLAGHENGADGGQLLSEMSLLVPTNLPEALRDVLVDLKELQPLRWPNGALQELGSGARWVVRGGRPWWPSWHGSCYTATRSCACGSAVKQLSVAL